MTAFDELLARVEALETRGITVDDIPIVDLQRRLEQKWTPDASILLQPYSITSDLLDTQLGIGNLQGGVWHAVGGSGEPAFQNGWVNYGQRPAMFYKDAAGVVHLTGLVKSGTIGTTAFTLPAGYRPSTTVGAASLCRFVCVTSPLAAGVVQIYGEGYVELTTGSNIYYDLSGISFRAEQ